MAGKASIKRDMKGQEKKKGPEKVIITNDIRRIWISLRRAWVTSFDAFTNGLSGLDDKQAEQLYGVVKYSLFKGSYVEIMREHPELKEFLKSDEDRICMQDIYEVLSWRLNKREQLPPDVKLVQEMKGRIGREAPDFSS